ncbi:leucyl/phenylalanyl-tRNA--protein transferase [Jannaschia pagri]|uniref:Leucyl/phenylalanyl-tRNA--protein transferase n=1 Tax=Jannaschia pagri TaxID=2829797 RepID=A0ABQ4NK41_9RHOB|nr:MULTISPECIES: leucyl/phenylalanyl-tRNA--protein transferase [unclassified Jannaschia]GIT90742.1 leucyl/phenylalanyl-tRNA--protein transferase [Jannaschia sp. AI_61]GIT94574.1 leucyl/phenylalanyl-tRNA--protein transferase [Jannaschia sp. AI_62]
MPRDTSEISAETLLMAYASGVFPMAEDRDDPDIFWVDPKLRGVLPLDGFRLSRSLAKTIRQDRYLVTLDQAFDRVIAGCAERDETWISAPIAGLYGQLHRLGFAHSVELWDGEALVGGVYGVAMGSAFFGESMFSRRRDASKVALAYLIATLRQAGYELFDTQFLTDHLASLGAVEIPRASYHRKLRKALSKSARMPFDLPSAQDVLDTLRQPPEASAPS